MPGGKAHGPNRDYQVLCQRIIMQLRNQEILVPYVRDGIDVPLSCGGTEVTFDIALVNPQGDLVVVECKRWKSAVNQGEMFKFWAEVEQLRQALGVGVAGIFMTKTGFQSGAENAALNPQGLGIEIAVCDETLTTNFDIVFRRYSYERAMLLQQLVAGRGIENSISHTATFGFSVVRNTKTNLD